MDRGVWAWTGHQVSCRDNGGAAVCGHQACPVHASWTWRAGTEGCGTLLELTLCKVGLPVRAHGSLSCLGTCCLWGALRAGGWASPTVRAVTRCPLQGHVELLALICTGPAQDPHGGPFTFECFYFLCVIILAIAAAAKSLQSCATLCDPIDGSPPGSPVPGILQARTLEWVAISFSNA